jgi:tetratricopeptide (TPR) repeat protein
VAAREGHSAEAVRYAWQAADHATKSLAYEEAVRLYEMASEAFIFGPGGDEATRCELLLALGGAKARAGDLTSARDTFANAAEVAREIEAPDLLARAALGYGGRFVWFRAGNDRRLIPLLEEALDAQPGNNAARVRLLARLAGALRDRPVPERRAALTAEAVEIARRLGDPATLAYALEGTYAALSWPRDTDAWLVMGRELGELAHATRDDELAFSGHLHAWGALMVSGEVREAEAEFAALTTLSEELRQPTQSSTLTVAQAARALLAGRFVEGERCIEQFQRGAGGHGAFAALEDATLYYVIHLQNWALRRERGGLEDVQEPLERFVAEYPTFFIFRCVLANTYSELGHREAAREELDRMAGDAFAALEVGTEWFFGASLLAETCSVLGETSYAERLYDALLPYGAYNVIAHPEFALGSASRYLGMLAATISLWDDAAGHFDRALEMNRKMGARPWVAHTLHDYASMLLERRGPGDRQLAEEMLVESLAEYSELGMRPWADRAGQLLASARGRD